MLLRYVVKFLMYSSHYMYLGLVTFLHTLYFFYIYTYMMMMYVFQLILLMLFPFSLYIHVS